MDRQARRRRLAVLRHTEGHNLECSHDLPILQDQTTNFARYPVGPCKIVT